MTTSSDPSVLLAATSSERPKPVVREEPPALEHEYDGIREYDNPLPRWWVLSFWASIVFSIGYAFHYHVSHNGESVASEYESDMRVARAAKAQAAMGESVSETSLAALMADASMMNDANQLYAQRCAACHADKGQGLIGPNLTDNAWIHGSGTLMDIFNTVSKGVLQKGMPAWEMQLTPVQLRQITAFIGTQRGKNIAGKAPEGTVSSEL